MPIGSPSAHQLRWGALCGALPRPVCPSGIIATPQRPGRIERSWQADNRWLARIALIIFPREPFPNGDNLAEHPNAVDTVSAGFLAQHSLGWPDSASCRVCSRRKPTIRTQKAPASGSGTPRRLLRSQTGKCSRTSDVDCPHLPKILEVCLKLKVRCVSAYVFSIENYKRSEEEVSALMKLAEEKLLELCQHGYALTHWLPNMPHSSTVICSTSMVSA